MHIAISLILKNIFQNEKERRLEAPRGSFP